jgi:hypothetical protein
MDNPAQPRPKKKTAGGLVETHYVAAHLESLPPSLKRHCCLLGSDGAIDEATKRERIRRKEEKEGEVKVKSVAGDLVN